MSSLKTILRDTQFCETDASAIETEIITTYERIAEFKLHPGDPVRLFLEGLAYIVAQQRFQIDYAAKQNLVYYADGDNLDHLGALTDTRRLKASSALVTLQFSLSEPLAHDVVIPAGTRATPDGKLFFATTEVASVPAGETSSSVEAACLTAGAAGNGFLPGQINRFVDTVQNVSSVANTTPSAGGSDLESDDNYRERIHISPEKYSVAGPDGAYQYWAKSAHQDIEDVSVSSPAPGEVDVCVLLKGGQIPPEEILNQVRATLDAESVIPLTDLCKVVPPTPRDYSISAVYFIHQDQAALAGQIQESVNRAVDNFVDWQRSKLGRDINPSQLTHLIQSAGTKRVEVLEPAFVSLTPLEVANNVNIEVQYGGLESD
jgi:phage-related baseplate assembly protein